MSWNANESTTLTPLHEACLSGNIKIVKTLLEYGASVHSKDYEGDTPHTDHLVVSAKVAKTCQSLSKCTLKCPDFRSDL